MRLGSRSPVRRPGSVRHRGSIPRRRENGKRWVHLIHVDVLVGDDGAGNSRWSRPGNGTGIRVTLRPLRVRGRLTGTSSFSGSALELLFQVLIFSLQVPDGLLEGVDISLILIVCTFSSGTDARVNVGISTILRVEVLIIMIIHVVVHV
jgi:hypothetical protein